MSPDFDVVARMRCDLTAAMKGRDETSVRALRTVLAAIANAEAPPSDGRVRYVSGGSGDVPRLELTANDIARIIRIEIADRRDTIEQITPHGREIEVDELMAEIVVLERYVD